MQHGAISQVVMYEPAPSSGSPGFVTGGSVPSRPARPMEPIPTWRIHRFHRSENAVVKSSTDSHRFGNVRWRFIIRVSRRDIGALRHESIV